jgi:hypothetical protein
MPPTCSKEEVDQAVKMITDLNDAILSRIPFMYEWAFALLIFLVIVSLFSKIKATY